MTSKLMALINALQKGQELSDPTTWKNRTIATNAIIAFIGAGTAAAVAMGYPVNFPPGTIEATASIIVIAVTFINNISHYATSKKVGLFPKKDPELDE